jgi:hypothetical protein
MRDERSRMAVSMAVRVGDGVLRGRIARASRARRVGRRAGDISGRFGMEGVSDIEIDGLEDGDDSGSKRAERMAESFGVSCEAEIVVVVITILEYLKELKLDKMVKGAGGIFRRNYVCY